MAHPNCQQHLVDVFYGPDMRFIQSLAPWQKVLLSVVSAPLLPVLSLFYILVPKSQVCNLDRETFEMSCVRDSNITHGT